MHGKTSRAENRSSGWLLAYCRLVRLPNVFTAIADILMGVWIVAPAQALTISPRLALLVLSSAALYWAGMVFNDLFDLEVDRRERPHRPLPAGAVSQRTALLLAIALGAAGVAAAAGVGPAAGSIAVLLALLILAYDGRLKTTFLGPVAMGGCRLLNVLLGTSAHAAAGALWPDVGVVSLAAVGNGVYITGVTWFARQEATTSRRSALVSAAFVMAAGLAVHGVLLALAAPPGWLAWIGLAAFVLVVGRAVSKAVQTPAPAPVQQAIKTTVLGLVALDAVLVLGFCGAAAGLAVLVLLVPALLLGRWVYST